MRAASDEPNLVSSAGLVPLLGLAEPAGLAALAQQHLTVPTDKGANAGAKVGSVPTAVSLNTSYLIDVKPLISGDGTVSMIVKSTSSDGARYYSEEGGTATQDPQLRVTCGGGSDTTPPRRRT